MRLTIIPVDGAVYKDDSVYLKLDLTSCQIPNNVWALQWNGTSGHIEFNTMIPNENITSLPAWATACLAVWEAKDYEVKNPPAPTPQEIITFNEEKAKKLLADSDWSQMSDVNLANKTEWVVYRETLRGIAISPTVDPVWPTKPQAIWS